MVEYRPAIHDTKKIIYGHMTGPIDIETVSHPFHEVQFHPERLDQPLHWRKPRRIGVCFTGDWMDDQVSEKWISDIYVVMMECERIGLKHQFFTLTKQSKRLAEVIRPRVPLTNLYNGVSITDQEDADRMLPELLQIPGKRWISIEPQLSLIDLQSYIMGYQNDIDGGHYFRRLDPGIHWIICGAESGPNRRPMPLEWAVDVVEQCQAAGVPAWVKQIDLNGRVCHDINLFPPELRVRQIP